MEIVTFRVAEGPPEVQESLVGEFAGDSDIQVRAGELCLSGQCAPDRVNAILDRVYSIAFGCHVEVTFGVPPDTAPAQPSPPQADPAPDDPPAPPEPATD